MAIDAFDGGPLTRVAGGGRLATTFATTAAGLDRTADRVAAVSRRRSGITDAMYLLSRAGDDGRVWFVAVLIESGTKRRPLPWAGSALIALGLESALVNWGIKNLVRRPRPPVAFGHGLRLRPPRDTSFPSGHASSAALMAMILSDDSTLPASLWWVLAGGIGWSRVHLGVHHGSDVLAGWFIGGLLGWCARPLVRRAAQQIATPTAGG